MSDENHNVCGALDNYKDNFTGQDVIWGIVCKYFFNATKTKY